jgi:hypothetical protein
MIDMVQHWFRFHQFQPGHIPKVEKVDATNVSRAIDHFEIITNGFYEDKDPAAAVTGVGLGVGLMSEMPLPVRTAWQALAMLNEEQIDELVHAMKENGDPSYTALVTRMATMALMALGPKEPADDKPF